MKAKTMVKKAILVALGVVLMAGVGFAASVQQQLTQESALEQVLKRGVLRVGFSTFVPWAMNDKQGNFIGYEIDVAKRLAQDMGVKVEFIPTKWSGIIPALLTGKFDIIIGGMGIRPDRNLKVNFSMPYYSSGVSMVANKELAKGFKSLEDFNRPEVVIATRTGTTAAAAAKKHMPKAQLSLFDDEAQGLQELLNGKAYAYLGDEPMPAFQAIKHADKLFLPLAESFDKSPIGMALRKGDVDTLNFINNWILLLQAEGWLAERKHYWFETRDWEKLIE
jgi:polar amino acid transport system substrate-binding protein